MADFMRLPTRRPELRTFLVASLASRVAALVLAALASGSTAPAIAQSMSQVPRQVRAEDDASHANDDTSAFHIPVPPSVSPAWWELEVGASAVQPFANASLCPAGRDCVANAGVSLGARVFRRTPDGFGVGAAYDLWALDSDSIYEIGLVHTLRFGFRYVLDATSRVQPWVGAMVGFLALGDASSVATIGGLLSGVVGVHVELTSDVALVGALDAWLLSTGPFRTRDSSTPRSEPFGVNLFAEWTLGILVRFGDLVAR